MRNVSYTAQWTAAARAIETERTEALFHDQFAAILAEPKGFQLLKKYGGGGLQEFVAIRTRYIDDAIESFVIQDNIRQVVIVAAGMDMRAYRLKWADGTIVYEVDHADLLHEKQKRLDQLSVKPETERRIVAADLSTEWLDALNHAGFDSKQSTLWITEALLFFLTDDQVKFLLKTLASASAPESWLMFDVINENLLRHVGSQLFLKSLREDGIPWLFGTNDPEHYFLNLGWEIKEIKEPGQHGAGKGRWPYKVFPRDVPNIPRNWLIKSKIVA